MASLNFLAGGRKPVIAVVGDSWTQATAKVHETQTIDRVIARELGFIDINLGIGGTGYNTDGSAKRFGDPSRVSPLVAANPDAILIIGSINDSNPARSGGVREAALAYFKAIREALPDTPVLVVGPQPSSGQLLVSKEHHENCAGLKAAVAEAGEGFAYRDWSGVADAQPVAFEARKQYRKDDLVHVDGGVYRLTTDWIADDPKAPLFETDHFALVSGSITGTGKNTAPKGDGRRDYFLQEDGSHPTSVGSEAFAADLAVHVLAGFSSLSRWCEKHDRARRVTKFVHKTDQTVPKVKLNFFKHANPMILAMNAYAQKDGANAGASIPRLNDIKSTPANAVHAMVFRTGDVVPGGLYVISSNWQIDPDGSPYSIYNHSQSDIKARSQQSGSPISDVELVEWCRANGYPVVFQYGPINSDNLTEAGESQFREFIRNWSGSDDIAFVSPIGYTKVNGIYAEEAPDNPLFLFGAPRTEDELGIVSKGQYSTATVGRFVVNDIVNKSEPATYDRAVGYTFYRESAWK